MNILEELKLSKKQNDNNRYEYLCQQFNAVDYAIKLEKYTIKLQQENEQLNALIKEYQKTLDEIMPEKMDIENNWNKLKKYIGSEWYCFDNESVEFEVAKSILNKMQELEGSDSNE